MSILSDHGLLIQKFEPTLAQILGPERGKEGANLLAEAARNKRGRVELCDWLYCLARAPQTYLWKSLVGGRNADADTFVRSIEQGLDHDGPPVEKDTPKRLIPSAVSERVLVMLERAERYAQERERGQIGERELLRALTSAGDDLLMENLGYWAPREGLERFLKGLEAKDPRPYTMFGRDGALELTALAPSAKALCRRLAEDAASMRSRRVTTRQLLYSLLSADSSVLAAALVSIGVTPKTDLLPTLTRELSRPGRGRLEGFTLSPATVFETIPLLFEHAHELAAAEGESFLSESHIIRSLLSRHSDELLRLLPVERQADLDRVRIFVESSSDVDGAAFGEGSHLTVREIEDHLREAILGQDQAIDRLMPWIKRLRFGLPRDDRPSAVLLFLGPTGAGKTQLAKELARHVFGSQEQMVFLEMGQFQTKESMSGFVGAPPGYVGYGEGLLTNGLGDKPESVVLFDEIEKAHTTVFDTLLRFADEGLISDPAGPVRDGRRCIIVMTTNAGQDWLRQHIAESPKAQEDPARLADQLFAAAMKELRERGFRPEFLGRVDERITFLPLTEPVCEAIVKKLLRREIERFRELKGVDISTNEASWQAVTKFLARVSHRRSLDEGARGAPRAINEHIVAPVIDIVYQNEQVFRRMGSLKVAVSTRGTGDAERIVVEAIA